LVEIGAAFAIDEIPGLPSKRTKRNNIVTAETIILNRRGSRRCNPPGSRLKRSNKILFLLASARGLYRTPVEDVGVPAVAKGG
jgi:hypothetical protein